MLEGRTTLADRRAGSSSLGILQLPLPDAVLHIPPGTLIRLLFEECPRTSCAPLCTKLVQPRRFFRSTGLGPVRSTPGRGGVGLIGQRGDWTCIPTHAGMTLLAVAPCRQVHDLQFRGQSVASVLSILQRALAETCVIFWMPETLVCLCVLSACFLYSSRLVPCLVLLAAAVLTAFRFALRELPASKWRRRLSCQSTGRCFAFWLIFLKVMSSPPRSLSPRAESAHCSPDTASLSPVTSPPWTSTVPCNLRPPSSGPGRADWFEEDFLASFVALSSDEVWALAHAEGSWLSAAAQSVGWFWEQIDGGRRYATWDQALSQFPPAIQKGATFWKRLIKFARESAQRAHLPRQDGEGSGLDGQAASAVGGFDSRCGP